jgi:hypothetical protein
MDRARFKYLVESSLQLPVDMLMVQAGQAPNPFEAIARSKAVALTTAQGQAA